VRWYDAWWAPRAKQGVKWFLLGQYLQHQAIPPEAMLELVNRYGRTLDSALGLLFSKLTPAVAGAVSGTIHDYEGEHGVLVSAPATLGLSFTTYGDNTLPGAAGRDAARTSGTAERLAVAAVGEARRQLDVAFAVGRELAAAGDDGGMTSAYSRLESRGVRYPYNEILNYVPRAVSGGTPVPWSHWRWGEMDRWFYDQANAYARDKIESRRAGIVSSLPDLTIQINDRPSFNVRDAVDSALRNFAADPLGVVGNLIMWPALDPSLVPATTP